MNKNLMYAIAVVAGLACLVCVMTGCNEVNTSPPGQTVQNLKPLPPDWVAIYGDGVQSRLLLNMAITLERHDKEINGLANIIAEKHPEVVKKAETLKGDPNGPDKSIENQDSKE